MSGALIATGLILAWISTCLVDAPLSVIALVGGSRDYARHPYLCPVCGQPLCPVGRWFPGLSHVGADPITCPHCGTVSRLCDLRQRE